MSFSAQRLFLVAVSATALSLSVSACTFTKEDPAAEKRTAQAEAAADRAALEPAEGMRLTPLFGEHVKGSDARFRRLEDAVQTLRDDVDVFAPAVDQRLEVVEGGLRSIAEEQHKSRVEQEKRAKEEANRPVGAVNGVRIGDHLDKTRLVLDATGLPQAVARLENDGRRLVVELPRLTWGAKSEWKANGGALVAGWNYADGKLSVDLIAPAILKQQQVLEGSGKEPKYRLVLDLFSRGIHQ